ncbi:MAG: shikimate kinase [Bacteroidales bacterium]|nr:shikimate kinase [Bacteroidales bacterium]
MNIYLIGFMGSGKSTTGRKIAASLRWNFADTDKLIETQYSMSVPEIFTQKGEKFFREAEGSALRSVSSKARMVVACGGCTPCSEENIRLMKSTGVVVYIKLPVAALVSRLEKSRTSRPLLKNQRGADLAATVTELMNMRSQWYEQADIVADGLTITIDDLTGQLAAFIRSSGAFL